MPTITNSPSAQITIPDSRQSLSYTLNSNGGWAEAPIFKGANRVLISFPSEDINSSYYLSFVKDLAGYNDLDTYGDPNGHVISTADYDDNTSQYFSITRIQGNQTYEVFIPYDGFLFLFGSVNIHLQFFYDDEVVSEIEYNSGDDADLWRPVLT